MTTEEYIVEQVTKVHPYIQQTMDGTYKYHCPFCTATTIVGGAPVHIEHIEHETTCIYLLAIDK